jgi:hypothetical protein
MVIVASQVFAQTTKIIGEHHSTIATKLTKLNKTIIK